MKRILTLIGLIALLALPTVAQTTTNVPPTSIWTGLEDIIHNIGADAPTNLAVTTYGVYAATPKQFGAGMFALWNISDNLGAGMGIEVLGKNWFMPSADVTLKTTIHPLAFLGLTNIAATPFAMAGVATPLGGTQASSLASLAGAGASIDIAKVLGMQLSIVGGDNYWSGAGNANGNHIYGGLALRKGF